MRRVLGALALLLTAATAHAEITGDAVRIGVLNDQSGPYADLAGPGSVVAAQMAIDDFGGTVGGKPIKLLVADHQNKADIGLSIARQWYGPDHVDMIIDFTNSAIALAVQSLAKDQNKLAIFTSASSSDLTGSACTATSIGWTHNNWSNAVAPIRGLMKQGYDSFFFITADYAFGRSLESDATGEIIKLGGTIKGSVRHPLNTADFSSFLLQAQGSGAKVVMLANAGADLVGSLKQSVEFGISPKQQVTAPIVYLSDVNSMGLKDAQGLLIVQSWYWDTDDKTRAWAKRYFAKMNRMPNDTHVGVYSAITHYLQAIQKAGTADTTPVVAAMKAAPVEDIFTAHGEIQSNNKLVFDRLLMRVKKPEESKYPWDYLEKVATIPAKEAFLAPELTGCPLSK